MTGAETSGIYEVAARTYSQSHARWLRFAGGEAQCAFEGAVTALMRPGARVLDVACGIGTVARRLLDNSDHGIDLTLLDSAQNMLDHCTDIPAVRVNGCMKALPFEDNSFDILTCAWGLETQRNPCPALAEFVRVTRPGGQICLVFCADRPAQSWIASLLRHRVSRSGRGTFLDHLNMKRLAQDAGAVRVQLLHCSGPAAAMILHV